MSRNNPTLTDVLLGALDSRLADVHVAIPARVESFDQARGCCSAQPLIRHAVPLTQLEADERTVERLPVINGVPVVFPGAGDYSITWPLAKGDIVLLVFSEAALDKWKTRGDEVDPDDDRRFALSDAIAIPGLRALKGKGAAGPVPTGSPPDGGAAPAALVIRAPEIQAGGTEALALRSEIEALRAKLNSHTHATSCGSGAGTAAATVNGQIPTAFDGTQILKGG